MVTKVFNPTDGPVVIDDEGRTLGGGEWADVDAEAEIVKTKVDQGLLLFPAEQVKDESSPAPSTKKTKE